MVEIFKVLIDGFFEIFNIVFWYQINLSSSYKAPIGILLIAFITLVLLIRWSLYAMGLIKN